MRSIGWEKEDLRQAETWSRTRRRVEEASAMGGHLVDAGREGRVRPVAERDSHSFETKWLERGMCERALVGAPVSRGVRHRRAPLRIAYSMLRAVNPPNTAPRRTYEVRSCCNRIKMKAVADLTGLTLYSMLQLACDRLLTITADVRHASSKRPSCKHMAQVVSPPCYPTMINRRCQLQRRDG